MSFQDLHYGATPLLLPNAWDIPSALALVDAGFNAIGTTSFGVASSLGQPDGGRASKEANLKLAAALSRLPVFVSLDIEDGYSDDRHAVAEYTAQLVDAGVSGINIEDSTDEHLVDPQLQAGKIAKIKENGSSLFVNARVDTYWLHQDETVAQTLDRAKAYVQAGADGVFVPGAAEPAVLAEITEALSVPVNTLVIPGMSLARIAQLGVRRVSTGSLPYRAAIHAAVEVATSVRDGRELPSATAYSRMQDRLVRYQSE